MATDTLDDTDYIIGTDDSEIDRLEKQHAVWREAGIDAWARSGIKPGMTVMDLGAGPGFASFDLAQIVGPTGKVIAVDQSPHFLTALKTGAKERGLTNIETVECDIAKLNWASYDCDAVWSRWCLCFLPEMEKALDGIDLALKPGGVYVAHEYVDYSTMQISPGHPVFEAFITAIEESWHKFGGDPYVAKKFPKLFTNRGWKMEAMKPIIYAANPGEAMWDWPMNWFKQAPERLVGLGFMSADQAVEFRQYIDIREADPDSLMMTPMVLETIARKDI